MDAALKNVCRLCLAPDPSEHLLTQERGIELCAQLAECTGVQVSPGDGLPAAVCAPCILLIPTAHAFVVGCRRADRFLRNQIASGIAVIKEELEDEDLDVNDWQNSESMDDSKDVKLHDIESSDCVAFSLPVKTKIPPKPITLTRQAKQKDKSEVNSLKAPDAEFPLKRKRRATLARGSQVCSTCGRRVCSASALEVHMRVHTGERPYACPHCPARFMIQGSLRTHTLRHENITRFTCEECGKGFILKTDLKIHSRIHTGERPYPCTYCGRAFSAASMLTMHLRQHTGDKRYACEHCPKAFVSLQALKTHRAIHSDERRFPCSVCDKRFKVRQALRLHEILHRNERTYICDKCGADFVFRARLVAHIDKIHSPLSGHCEKCNKHFANLVAHEAMHAGRAPHVCEQCGRRYARACNLEAHRASHLDEAMFRCPADGCARTFLHKKYLDTHVQNYHLKEARSQACKRCGKGFYRLCDLHRHERSCLNKVKENKTSKN